ncbi:MAG: hypothetical protein RBS24_04370 [Bacilli bacterium]|nr:hypothetical protein [Bacilli bacterium]
MKLIKEYLQNIIIVSLIVIGSFSFSIFASNTSSWEDHSRMIAGITNTLVEKNISQTLIKVNDNHTSIITEKFDIYNNRNYGYSTMFALSNQIYSSDSSFDYSIGTIEKSKINEALGTNGLAFINKENLSLFEQNSIVITSLYAQLLISNNNRYDDIQSLIGEQITVINTEFKIAAIYDPFLEESENRITTNSLFQNTFGNVFFIMNSRFYELINESSIYFTIGQKLSMNQINFSYVKDSLNTQSFKEFLNPLDRQWIDSSTYLSTIKEEKSKTIFIMSLIFGLIFLSIATVLANINNQSKLPFKDPLFALIFIPYANLLLAFFLKTNNYYLLKDRFYISKLLDRQLLITLFASQFVFIIILFVIKFLKDLFDSSKNEIQKDNTYTDNQE